VSPQSLFNPRRTLHNVSAQFTTSHIVSSIYAWLGQFDILDIREELFGHTHLAIVENLHHMGWMLDSEEHQAEAQAYHERVLAIRRAILGDDHLDTAESFNYVGTILH